MPGSKIFIMDLYRPRNMEEAMRHTDKYAGNDPDIFKMDFHNSLLAAFEAQEVISQLQIADLDLSVEKVTDRHIIIYGSV